jgi:serine/threonine protein kinase
LPFFAAVLSTYEQDGLRYDVYKYEPDFAVLGKGDHCTKGNNAGSSVRAVRNLLKDLAVFHQRGFIHGDVYPHNLLYNSRLGSNGIRIIDLGNVRRNDGGPNSCPDVDVYRCAWVLVGLLTGSSNPCGVHDAVGLDVVDAATSAIENTELRNLLRRALSPDASRRFQSADAFRQALEPFALVADQAALETSAQFIGTTNARVPVGAHPVPEESFRGGLALRLGTHK